MQSVFMDELKEELAGKLSVEESGVMTSYRAIAASNNISLAFIATALGNLAFTIFGYHQETIVRNTPFVFSSSIKLLIVGTLVGIVLWILRSFGSYGSWKFFSDYKRQSDVYSFLTVEGMSDFVFVVFIPIYLLSLLFDMGSYAIGAAVLTKAYFMYASYPAVLPKVSSLDRVLCILSSFGMLVLMRGIIYVLFGF